MRKLATQWTEHCKTQEQKDKLEQLIRSSTMSLGRLREIVKQRMSALQVTERKADAYANPNWAYMQAHNNGMLAALASIDQLLSFMDKE